MGLGSKILAVLSAVLLLQLVVPSRGQEYSNSNGTYTSSMTSSCFSNDYSKWGPDRRLAVGVSPALFKVGTNGSPNSCGRKLEVGCVGSIDCVAGNPTINVTIVDLCEDCDDLTVMLKLAAYRKIAKPDSGVILLKYRFK